MKRENVKTRKDAMIYFLLILNEKNKQVPLGEMFFESGYARGIEAFEGIMDEMDEIGWIKKRDTPDGSVPGMPHLRTIKRTYEISIKGIEYLASVGLVEDSHKPIHENSRDRGVTMSGTHVTYNEQSNYGNQSHSSHNNTTQRAAATATPTIKKIFIGVLIAVLGGLIIWYLTTHVL